MDEECSCFVCKRYTRGYLHHLFKSGASSGPQLLTYHNIAYMMRLTRGMRQAIIEDRCVHVGFACCRECPFLCTHILVGAER